MVWKKDELGCFITYSCLPVELLMSQCIDSFAVGSSCTIM